MIAGHEVRPHLPVEFVRLLPSADTDAALIGLCEQFWALEQANRQTAENDAPDYDAVLQRNEARQLPLLRKIGALRAVTPEGLAARARLLARFAAHLTRGTEDDGGTWDSRIVECQQELTRFGVRLPLRIDPC